MGQVIVLAALQAVIFIQHIHQLRESRRYIHAFFVLNPLQTLPEDFFDNHGVFCNIRIVFPQIQEQGHERRLAVGGHQGIDLVLDSLNTGVQFFPQTFIHNRFNHFRVCLFPHGAFGPFQEFFPAAPQIFAQMPHVNRLTAILAGSNGSDNLGHYVTGYLEALRRFNHLAVHHRTIVQHVADINQAAVENRLDKIIHIVKMDYAFIMGFGNFFRQNHPAGQVLGNLTGDQVPLGRSHNRIFIAVFFHNIFVAVTDQRKDGFIRRIGFTHQRPAVTVNNVGFCQIKLAGFLQLAFHNILNILHQQAGTVLPLYICCNFFNLAFGNTALLFYSRIGFLNGHYYFLGIKVNCRAVALNYFHAKTLLHKLCRSKNGIFLGRADSQLLHG